MPNINDNNIGILHNNNNFIDYDSSRYIKCEVLMQILFEMQIQNNNNNNTIFKKLRDNSDIEVFNKQETFNTTCGICIEKMKNKDIVRTLKCKHSFHINCIDQWFEKKCCCPYCNTEY